MPRNNSFITQSAPVHGTAGHRLPSLRTERSALKPYPLFIISLLLLISGISPVSGALTNGNTVGVTDPLDAAALVYVSGYNSSPEIFYPGETGTITVHVTNAANTSVSVSQPNLMDPHVKIINSGSFATATAIGPGETIDYTFIITADGSDGTYLPLFTVSTNVYGGTAIHSQVRLKIDSTEVRTSIAVKPDTFSLSTKDMVNVSVVNPRKGDITNVLIVPEVNGAAISPDESFVGTLKAGTSVQVPFAITPEKETAVTFHVSYYNGDNKHSKDLVLPITPGDNKMGAQMVVNNIESTSSGSTVTLKGDVTNNGLTDARSVLVTIASPATPVNPNPVYAIGNLAPDDFSSFEVTYTQKTPGTVPIVVEYKDADGNTFSQRFTYDSTSNGADPGTAGSAGVSSGASSGTATNRRGGMFGSFGSGLNQVPVIPIAVGLVALITLVIAWRKGLLKRFTGRFQKKDESDEEQKEH
jgi:hypothetical protein